MKLQKIYTDVVKLYFRRGPEDEGHRLIYQCIEDGVGFSLSAYCAFSCAPPVQGFYSRQTGE